MIGVESRSLTTRDLVLDVTDPSADVARIAVVERHLRTGRIGLGYVHGFGLSRGAIASTVAHDAHNCMVVGALDNSGPAEMAVAVARLAEIGGGQVAVRDGRVLAEVELPIGGLMSDKSIEEVAREVRAPRRRRLQRTGRDDRLAFHAAELPRAVGAPGAADHRQGSRRCDEVRAHRRRRTLSDVAAALTCRPRPERPAETWDQPRMDPEASRRL